jgi:hypothetical protein
MELTVPVSKVLNVVGLLAVVVTFCVITVITLSISSDTIIPQINGFLIECVMLVINNNKKRFISSQMTIYRKLVSQILHLPVRNCQT